jgi:hypothetical protein
MENVLDRFLEAALYSFDLAERGADKARHDRANELLIEKEHALISELNLDLNVQADSDKFDRILELTHNYREDESQYEALVKYVESLR